MENQDYGDDFIIFLSIENTEFEGVEVKVENPNRNIRDIITNMIRVFNLPNKFENGDPIQWMLIKEEDEMILDFTDDRGVEMCLLDYDVKPGDRLFAFRTLKDEKERKGWKFLPILYGCYL